jgi:hypothetical protein
MRNWGICHEEQEEHEEHFSRTLCGTPPGHNDIEIGGFGELSADGFSNLKLRQTAVPVNFEIVFLRMLVALGLFQSEESRPSHGVPTHGGVTK